jgi:hypothetical protein
MGSQINPTIQQSDSLSTFRFDIELVSYSVRDYSVRHFINVEYRKQPLSLKCLVVDVLLQLYRTHIQFKNYDVSFWEMRFLIPSKEQQRIVDLLKQLLECSILRESYLNAICVVELCEFQNKVLNFKKLLIEKGITLFICLFILCIN